MGIFNKLFGKNKRSGESTSTSKVKNGMYVTCASCQCRTQIKIFETNQITIMDPDASESFAKQNIAMKCQDCDSYLCFSCVLSNRDDVGISFCPICGKRAGPCFIAG